MISLPIAKKYIIFLPQAIEKKIASIEAWLSKIQNIIKVRLNKI